MKTVAAVALAVLALAACDRAPPGHKEPRKDPYSERPINRTDEFPALRLPEDVQETPIEVKDTVSNDEFVTKAAVGGNFEVLSARAALDRGITGPMKAFAERMIADHGEANEELLAIAKDKGWEVPRDLDVEHSAMLDDVKNAQTDELSTVYHRIQLGAHQDAMELFERCSGGCADKDLRAFAVKTLKVVRAHHAELDRVSSR
jgi:putative membrane protein